MGDSSHCDSARAVQEIIIIIIVVNFNRSVIVLRGTKQPGEKKQDKQRRAEFSEVTLA